LPPAFGESFFMKRRQKRQLEFKPAISRAFLSLSLLSLSFKIKGKIKTRNGSQLSFQFNASRSCKVLKYFPLSLSLLSLSSKIKGKIKTRNSSHELAPSVWRIHFHKKETKETNGIQTRPFSRTLVFVSFVSISKNKRKTKNKKWLP
jgi:hypothetical protein